jgi:hypothetical protein
MFAGWFQKTMMRFIKILIFCFVFHSGVAQQQFSFNDEVWWGVMTSVRVAEKWSVWNDAHFVDETFFIYRTGMTYHNKRDNIVTTAGLSWLVLPFLLLFLYPSLLHSHQPYIDPKKA